MSYTAPDYTAFKTVEQDAFVIANNKALKAAEQVVTTMILKHGDIERGACGFAWVTVPGKIRKNSKLYKAFEAVGFSFDYLGRMQLWSPGYHGQSIDVKEACAKAYAEEFEAITGIELTTGSRLD